MEETLTIHRHISREEQGSYFEIPLDIPDQVCRLDVRYQYPRLHREPLAQGKGTKIQECNVIDLGLNSQEHGFIGASGSNRTHIWVSAGDSVKGYQRVQPKGRWSIIVGAYKIQPEGVDVTYQITFTYKERALYLGDTHMHTLGSDGNLSVAEVAHQAIKGGLDYIFVTDHNNCAHNLEIPAVEGITVIPGMEWTHYNGHAGLLGHPRPVRSPFCINDREGMLGLLQEAREHGAAIVLNHMMCPDNGWKWGTDDLEYDMIEVWNGGTKPKANLAAVAWWHQCLCQGKRIPIIGGSDFHSIELLRMVGLPCTAVYAMSDSPQDILDALQAGHSYILLNPGGPRLFAEAEGSILGEIAPAGSVVHASFQRLQKGDVIRCITDQGTEEITCESAMADFQLDIPSNDALFLRFELYRNDPVPMPGIPFLLSNPIYFE